MARKIAYPIETRNIDASFINKMERMAAGVVQITKSTTIAIKTTTSIRSSGLCSPLRREDTR